jgi:hypothetical protein
VPRESACSPQMAAARRPRSFPCDACTMCVLSHARRCSACARSIERHATPVQSQAHSRRGSPDVPPAEREAIGYDGSPPSAGPGR